MSEDIFLALLIYIGPFLLLGLGFFLLWATRMEDAENFIVARAPQLRVKDLRHGDDAWVFGEVICKEPISVPHFDYPCIYFDYKVEEYKSYTDHKGRRRRRWETVSRKKDTASFWILDEADQVLIQHDKTSFEHPEQTDYSYENSRRRHSASYEVPSGYAGVMGYFNGENMGEYQNNPLIGGSSNPALLIRNTREEYIREEERTEAHLRTASWITVWLGFSAVFSLLHALELMSLPTYSLFVAMLPCFGLWCLYTYNTFSIYRARTENAQKQIDIELRQRSEMVPQLERVVKAACAHEKELLGALAELRSMTHTLSTEKNGSSPFTQFVMLEERYPNLTTIEQYRALQEALTVMEEKLAHVRNFYNQNVEEYNSLCCTFPYVIFARLGKFQQLDFYQSSREQQEI